MYIFNCVSFNSSKNEKCFRQKLYIKSKHNLRSVTFFLPESRAVCEIMWENIVESDRFHIDFSIYFYCKSLCILVVCVFLLFVHVFLTLSMYSYYSSMYS